MRREFGPKAYRDPTVLRRLYLGRGLSVRQVADRLGCGPTTVHDWMTVYGLPRREEPAELAEARVDRDGRDGTADAGGST